MAVDEFDRGVAATCESIAEVLFRGRETMLGRNLTPAAMLDDVLSIVSCCGERSRDRICAALLYDDDDRRRSAEGDEQRDYAEERANGALLREE